MTRLNGTLPVVIEGEEDWEVPAEELDGEFRRALSWPVSFVPLRLLNSHCPTPILCADIFLGDAELW